MNETKTRAQLNPRTLARYALQALILGVVASSLVFFYSLERETWTALRDFHWQALLLVVPMVLTAWTCQALRVFVLTRSMGYPVTFAQSVSVAMSLEFGVAATPAGVGGAIIRLGLLHRAGVPLAHGTSMLAVDVALDAAFILLIFPLAVWAIVSQPTLMYALEDIAPTRVILLLLAFLTLIATLVFLIRSGMLLRGLRRAARWPFGQQYRMAGRMRWYERRFNREWTKTKQGVHQLYVLNRWAVAINFVLAAIQWLCRYGVLPVVLWALSVPVNPFLLMLIQAALFTLSLLVVLPGGGGAVEVTALLILRSLIPGHLGGVAVLLWRFFTYYLYLLVGGMVFFFTLSRLSKIYPQRAAAAGEDGLDLGDRPAAPTSQPLL